MWFYRIVFVCFFFPSVAAYSIVFAILNEPAGTETRREPDKNREHNIAAAGRARQQQQQQCRGGGGRGVTPVVNTERADTRPRTAAVRDIFNRGRGRPPETRADPARVGLPHGTEGVLLRGRRGRRGRYNRIMSERRGYGLRPAGLPVLYGRTRLGLPPPPRPPATTERRRPRPRRRSCY